MAFRAGNVDRSMRPPISLKRQAPSVASQSSSSSAVTGTGAVLATISRSVSPASVRSWILYSSVWPYQILPRPSRTHAGAGANGRVIEMPPHSVEMVSGG